MRKMILAATSATALLFGGAALAQDTVTTSPSTPTTAGAETAPTVDLETERAGQSGLDVTTDRAVEMDATAALDTASAEELMGKTVIGANGDEIGEVKDVVLDSQTGEAKQLIVGSGGFLGIGEKDVAIDFADAQVTPGSEEIEVSGLTRDQIKEMESFEYEEATVSLARDGEEVDTALPARDPGQVTGNVDSIEEPGIKGSTGMDSTTQSSAQDGNSTAPVQGD